jgi:hypothetical protein
MTYKSKITLVAVLFAAFATPALALDDEWTVDSGRYVNGQVPSYTQSAPLYLTTRAPRVIERRNAAGFSHFDTFINAPSGRDAMVQSLGN